MATSLLVDTHCHLQFPEFDDDRNEVLERARRAGVAAFVVVGVDLLSSRTALELAERHPDVHAAVGMHPHDASEFTERKFHSLRRHADSQSVVAIGEIGLDYYRNFSPPRMQRLVFLRMLELAAELKLPVIVHSRGSDTEMRRILGDWALSVQVGWPKEKPLGVMHSFGEDLGAALHYIELGFLVSIPATCTRPKANMVRAVASGIPLSSMVVETDSPYQAPQSYRGQRNEPSYLPETVHQIAQLRGVSFDFIVAETAKGAALLFRLPDFEMVGIGDHRYEA